MIVSVSLAGCGAWDTMSTSAKGSGAGLQAVLRYGGVLSGSGQGDIRFADRGDGVLMTLSVTNLRSGVYRVAIHQNPICSSQNLYSAGPVWEPAGNTRPAREMMPELVTDSDGDGNLTAQIPGIHTTGPDGLQGRSVVLHSGTRIEDAEPGKSNDRVLCGVLGPTLSFAF